MPVYEYICLKYGEKCEIMQKEFGSYSPMCIRCGIPMACENSNGKKRKK